MLINEYADLEMNSCVDTDFVGNKFTWAQTTEIRKKILKNDKPWWTWQVRWAWTAVRWKKKKPASKIKAGVKEREPGGERDVKEQERER